MLEKLEAVYAHFKEIELLLSSPEVASDVKRFTKLNKEYRDLEEIVQTYFEYKNCYHRIAEARDILKNEKDKEQRDKETKRWHKEAERQRDRETER